MAATVFKPLDFSIFEENLKREIEQLVERRLQDAKDMQFVDTYNRRVRNGFITPGK
jgi:hypothetical protein